MSEAFQKPFISRPGVLNPAPREPEGYVTKDGVWAAVPFGKKFMIIHNGQQGDVFKTLDAAKKYISKQNRVQKPKKASSSLEEFL
jgi:hypothetical protein